ncbi:MAG: EamA family transporter, partial [Syntrophales bacterium LBB04]|nr:EamA family transporter [Syntrophales bacterium LBB04]
MLLIAVLYLLCASTFTISKAALMYATPMFYVAARMIIGGAVLLAYYWFKAKKEQSVKLYESTFKSELSAMQPLDA